MPAGAMISMRRRGARNLDLDLPIVQLAFAQPLAEVLPGRAARRARQLLAVEAESPALAAAAGCRAPGPRRHPSARCATLRLA
jgi:hypothetical protein